MGVLTCGFINECVCQNGGVAGVIPVSFPSQIARVPFTRPLNLIVYVVRFFFK